MADSRGVSDGAAACGRGRFNFLKDREKRRFLLFLFGWVEKGFSDDLLLENAEFTYLYGILWLIFL